MAISERQRREVFEKFEEVFGPETADVVMQMFPRVTNDELATRSDVTATATLLRGEMAELRVDVRTEIAGLQRWMAGIAAANAVAVVTALVA